MTDSTLVLGGAQDLNSYSAPVSETFTGITALTGQPDLRGHLASWSDVDDAPWLDNAFWPPVWTSASADAISLQDTNHQLGEIPQRNPTGRMSDSPDSVQSGITGMADEEVTSCPVLGPLLPYISGIVSPQLASSLLQAYFADYSANCAAPASPLLLTHLFRRSSFLTTSEPRSCTPALLASMLLIAAHNTESPFFGASPFARVRLEQRLLRLTLDCLRQRPPVVEEGHDADTVLQTVFDPEESSVHVADSKLVQTGPTNVHYRDNPLDDIITYLHLALVTTAAESRPVGSAWWERACKLAKHHGLNIDETMESSRAHPVVEQPEIETGTRTTDCPNWTPTTERIPDGVSVMSVANHAVVDDASQASSRSDAPARTIEEIEEKRRLWWTLYIWDRHMALRYNKPLLLVDTECQEMSLPLPDAIWQSEYMSAYASITANGYDGDGAHRPRGPPSSVSNWSTLDVLLPFMRILGQIIEHRRFDHHSKIDNEFKNIVNDAYIQNIIRELDRLEASLISLKAQHNSTAQSMSSIPARHIRLLEAHAEYFLRTLHTLAGTEWDKLTLIENPDAWKTSDRVSDAIEQSFVASRSALAILSYDPCLKYNALFMGLFFFHGATLPWSVATTTDKCFAQDSLAACRAFVRIFEVANCTYITEFMRKMRTLLIMVLGRADSGTDWTASEQLLVMQILKTYRWSRGGHGLL